MMQEWAGHRWGPRVGPHHFLHPIEWPEDPEEEH